MRLIVQVRTVSHRVLGFALRDVVQLAKDALGLAKEVAPVVAVVADAGQLALGLARQTIVTTVVGRVAQQRVQLLARILVSAGARAGVKERVKVVQAVQVVQVAQAVAVAVVLGLVKEVAQAGQVRHQHNTYLGEEGKPMGNIINLNKNVIVSIDEQDSLLVERKFYEHQAGRDNIAFLMKDKEINWDILQHYVDVVETRWVELEMLKGEMDKKYRPDSIKGKNYGYEFLFDTHEMKYTVGA